MSANYRKKTIAIQVEKIVSLQEDNKSECKFVLESPQLQGITFPNNFLLRGWVMGNKIRVKAIEVIAHEQVIGVLTLTRKRQDIVGTNDEIYAHDDTIGFYEKLNLINLESFAARRNQVVLRAVFSDDTREDLISIIFKYIIYEHPGPDFMVIGAMKAATSGIYQYLVQHPQVMRRHPKEVHFFSSNFHKGIDWYITQFQQKLHPEGKSWLIAGEASPSYLTHPQVPERVFEFFPQTKIIVSLRNATERAVSMYYHQFNRVKDDRRSIEEAFSELEFENIDKHPKSLTHRYINHSLYSVHLKRWLKYFPREQILILNYHDLANNPDYFIQQLFDFLDLKDHRPSSIKRVYSNKYPATPSIVKERLDRYFHQYNQELEEMLKIKIG